MRYFVKNIVILIQRALLIFRRRFFLTVFRRSIRERWKNQRRINVPSVWYIDVDTSTQFQTSKWRRNRLLKSIINTFFQCWKSVENVRIFWPFFNTLLTFSQQRKCVEIVTSKKHWISTLKVYSLILASCFNVIN